MLKSKWILGILAFVAGCSLLPSSSPAVKKTLPAPLTALPYTGLKAVSGHAAPIVAIAAVSQAGKQLLSVDDKGKVLLWDLKRNLAYEWFTLTTQADQVVLLPEHGLMAAGSPGNITVFDVATKSVYAKLDRVKARVTALQFQSDGEALLIAAADGRIYRWKYDQEFSAKTQAERE